MGDQKSLFCFPLFKTMQVDELPFSQLPSSTRAKDVISSTNVSHYELQVEIGNYPELILHC